jgi:heme A synthase
LSRGRPRATFAAMKLLRTLAAVTAAFGYLLVALSPVVRITGSGLGCGDHWPLCNGRLIPPLDNLPVMIEWGHRLAVLGLSVLVVALLVTAWVRRREPGGAGPGGVLRPAVLAALLLVVQSLLGAVTVWLKLPPAVVVVHLANAIALLATLCVAALRAHRALAGPPAPASSPAWRSAVVAAVMTAVVLLLGALTANLGAGFACSGFPLCNGRLWPSAGGGGLAHIQWMHRLIAYALFLHVIGMVARGGRRREPASYRAALWLVLLVLAAQVTVGAVMVLHHLAMPLRVAHGAVGALVWVAMVGLTWIAARHDAAWQPAPNAAERGEAIAQDQE